MRVGVTGGSRPIGRVLVETLRARGAFVSVLLEPDAGTAVPRRLGVRVVAGDSADPISLGRTALGADVFFHLATEGADGSATRAALEAARRAGVRRFVHLSSASVYGLPVTDLVTEETPAQPTGIPRIDAKVEAERDVFEFGAREGIEAVALRPVLVYGPDDRSFLPRVAGMLRKGRFVYVGDEALPLNVVHVDNIVDVAIAAATHPAAAGQAFNVTDGEAVPLGQFVHLVCRALGVPPPRRTVPASLARLAARMVEGAYRIARAKSPPEVTAFAVAALVRGAVYSCDKARALLGYRPRYTVPEGVARVLGELSLAA